MCNVTRKMHDNLHYHQEKVSDLDTNEMIIESLDSTFDYIEFLQAKLSSTFD